MREMDLAFAKDERECDALLGKPAGGTLGV